MVLPHVPESEVRSRIERAAGLSPGIPAHWAVGTLGNDPDVVEAFGLDTPIASLEATEFGYYVPDYSDYSRAWDEVKAA